MDELFELTEKQRKAFLNLKKAYKECGKLGILFYNNYGTVGALDSKKLSNYSDDDSGIMDTGQNMNNEFKHPAGDSWADDTHYFHLA